MRKLILLLFAALPLLAVNPVATIATPFGAPSLANGQLWDTNVLFHYSASGAYNAFEIAYSPNTSLHCAGLTPSAWLTAGGLIQPFSIDATRFATDGTQSIELAGLAPSTTYNFCIQLSDDSGSTWDSTNEYAITTADKQSQLPRPAKNFGSNMPDTTGYSVVTAASDCSDINSLIDSAMFSQASTGTIIKIPHAASCTPLQDGLYHQMGFEEYSADIVSWVPSNVTVGSPGTITLPSGVVSAMTEGDMVTIGKHYDGSLPGSGSCAYGNGLVPGAHFYVHKVNTTDIQLHCEQIDGTPDTALMAFGDQGSTVTNFELVPWHSVTGACPTAQGDITCQYWARNLKWIIVEGDLSDTTKMPPYGTRIDPMYATAGNMPTLINPIANSGGTSTTTMFVILGNPDGSAQTMVGNIMIRGLDLTFQTNPSLDPYCIQAQSPEFSGPVVFAQNYLHGLGTPQRWGFASCPAYSFSGTNFSFRDNYIDNMTHWNSSPAEGSGGNFPKGPGPLQFINNFIQGVGVSAHWDGNGNHDSIRGDNTILRNQFTAKTSWMFGSPDSDGFWYGQRQPFEFKSGYRNHVEGNIIERGWTEVTPASVLLALTSTGEGGNEGEGTTDMDVVNNIFRDGPGITNFTQNTVGGNPQTIPPNRNLFRNNLAYNINDTWTTTGATAPRGWVFEGPLGSSGTGDHNTLAATTGAIPIINLTFNTRSSNMRIMNNFFYLNQANQGISSEGTVGPNNPCTGPLAQNQVDCWYPGNIFAKNVLGSVDSTQAQMAAGWPSGFNLIPTDPTDTTLNKWMDPTNNNYALRFDSPYAGAGRDGHDVGVYMPDVWNATGVVTYTSVTGIGATSGQLNFNAPDTYACSVDLLTHAWPITGTDTPIRFVDTSGAQPGAKFVALNALSAGTQYYGKIQCPVQQPEFQFRTQ